MLNRKTEWKSPTSLVAGDQVYFLGMTCEVKKVETVFHRTPDSRVRISMTILDPDGPEEAILLLPHGRKIALLK